MRITVGKIRTGVLILLLAVASVVWLMPYLPIAADDTRELLSVHFFAVGQGDAIFITTPQGVQVLIDGGADNTVLRLLAERLSFFDTDLDMVVATHPDLDHVGGLVDVLARYEVTQILMTQAEGDTSAAAAFAAAARDETEQVTYVKAGDVFTVDASTTISILSPTYDPRQLESNAGSIVLLLQHGEVGFMLTGDAPQGIEDYLVSKHGNSLEAEVLKLGHHGSDTSSSDLFLEAVDPLYAVVSAGKHNRYNHPHPDVIERVYQTAAEVVSTQDGTVSFYSDGIRLWSKNK